MVMGGDKGNKELEVEIFNRFSRIVRDKFASLADDTAADGGAKIKRLDALYALPEYDAEKRVLNEMNSMGLSKGILSGLACFAFLRVAPGVIARALRRRAGTGTEGAPNPFHPSSSSSSSGGYKFDVAPLAERGQADQKRPSFLFRAARLCLDTFVSLTVGSYASLVLIDQKKMMTQFSEIPLIQGRSILSEGLCDDFTREFRRFDRHTWDENHPSLSGENGSRPSGEKGLEFRDTIEGFVANCRRRRMYEQELRKEQGFWSKGPVDVPSPGVPRDILVSLGDLMDEGNFGDVADDAGEGNEYFGKYFGSPSDEDQDSFST